MRILVFALLSLVSSTALAASPCDYYKQKANLLGCDSRNYLVRFGDRYCRAFEKREVEFSSAARPVLSRIRGCLILEMDAKRPTCSTSETIGYESHVGCYVEQGFCGLSREDKLRILWVVRAEITKSKFRSVANRILRACRERSVFE